MYWEGLAYLVQQAFQMLGEWLAAELALEQSLALQEQPVPAKGL
jgi:hypothetical protein